MRPDNSLASVTRPPRGPTLAPAMTGNGHGAHDRISVLIVDDERTFGEALQLALDHEADLEIVDVATDGADAVRAVGERSPDVVIMDVPMSVQAGAVGLLRKTEAVANVAVTVRKAYEREALHPEAEVERAMRRLRHRRDADDDARRRLDRLTPRETEILELMARGNTPDDIAALLSMSPNTLRTHTQNVLTKLGVHSKMEALVLAIRHGKVATVDVTEDIVQEDLPHPDAGSDATVVVSATDGVT
jgi:DNA-binding NarL/FixJ family response regulator